MAHSLTIFTSRDSLTLGGEEEAEVDAWFARLADEIAKIRVKKAAEVRPASRLAWPCPLANPALARCRRGSS